MEMLKIAWFVPTGYAINQYWFFKALIVIYIFFPIIKRAFDADKRSVQIFTIIVGAFTIGNFTLYLCHQLFSYLMGGTLTSEIRSYVPWINFCADYHHSYSFVYFILGGIMFHNGCRCSKKVWLVSIIFVIFWCTAILFSHLFYASGVEWDPCFNAYSSPMTFSMTVCLYLLLSRQSVAKLPAWMESIGKNTLGIFLIHYLIIYFTIPLVSVYQSIFAYFVYAIAILLVSWIIVIVLKRIPYIRILFAI